MSQARLHLCHHVECSKVQRDVKKLHQKQLFDFVLKWLLRGNQWLQFQFQLQFLHCVLKRTRRITFHPKSGQFCITFRLKFVQILGKGAFTLSVFTSVFLLRSFCSLALAARFMKKLLLLPSIFVILDVLHLWQAKKFRESCCKCPNAKRAKQKNRRENR